MTCDPPQKLHWTQRIALVRHNLHSARRTNDFSFFKSLQAHALIEGTDHVALLYSSLGDSADSVLSTLDNLNAGIAYVHQDAFKALYDSVKTAVHTGDQSISDRRSLLRVDAHQQRDMADHAIDKTTNSAINLIQAQPAHCQDAVANAWITGTTIIADAVCICLNEMSKLEVNPDDFIRLEYAWNSIQSAVDAAISALRGIFTLMGPPSVNNQNLFAPSYGRNLSVSSANSDNGGSSTRSRSSSTASAFSFIKRALSNSQSHPPSASKAGRSGSIALSMPPPEANSRGFRASMNNACPTKMSTFGGHPHTHGDYFAFDMGKTSGKDNKERSAVDDLMQIESLDPLYSPVVDETIKMPVPLTLRRLSESFDMSPVAAIAV
ncbi:hypothetical protein BKA66DRAFT_513316 [Pyrenochaeta sp. MPI-SDFR-AT-0127]|nr:hypothetical protein BKA66DRAFT_513316 [Pyrenochaeta sp. MPI-SDFR-AT-0127]